MTFWYTARNKYDSSYQNGISWEKYIKWSKLTHLTEVISLDVILCELTFEADYESEEIYKHAILDEYSTTDLFNSIQYVLKKVEGKSSFNLLAVVKEPDQECNKIDLKNFDFLGYDLLDKDYSASALTNCGGFDETFLPKDLNQFGLIDHCSKAIDIRRRLIENNHMEHHANCYVFALWRHKTIGRLPT